LVHNRIWSLSFFFIYFFSAVKIIWNFVNVTFLSRNTEKEDFVQNSNWILCYVVFLSLWDLWDELALHLNDFFLWHVVVNFRFLDILFFTCVNVLHTDNLVCDFNYRLLLMSCMLITLFVFIGSCFIIFVVVYTLYINCWLKLMYIYLYTYIHKYYIFVAFFAQEIAFWRLSSQAIDRPCRLSIAFHI